MNIFPCQTLRARTESAAWPCRGSWGRGSLTAGWTALLLCVTAPDLRAQRLPDLGYAYPAGGQQGSTFQVGVGGQNLNGVTEGYVSGDGVEVRVVDYHKPMPQKRLTEIREKMQEVRTLMNQARKEGKISSPEQGMSLFVKSAEEAGVSLRELKEAAEYRHQQMDPKRQLNPQIAEAITLQVTIAPDASFGMRELRLASRAGLSDPIRFCVGHLPEVCELPIEPELTWEYLVGASKWKAASHDSPHALQQVSLPTVINGQILPGEVDRFRFSARKGQSLVAVVSAQSMMPYLADAVPGWFQATLTLRDANGNELGYADDFQFHPDPVLHCEIPQEGEYSLEIKDSIYRGREDFVYRIEVGELPFITSIFPLGGRAGETTTVELTGWNLPVRKLPVRPPSADGRSVDVSVAKEGHCSNRVPFSVGTLPETREREPNAVDHPQHLALPLVVNGRIDRAGDQDVFQFAGRAGDVISVEVFARRLDSPLDSLLKLTDSSGLELVANDDHPDPAAGLITHQADSLLQVTLPDDGLYYLHVGDAQGMGGAAYAYRLQVNYPIPDFELRVVPSSLSVRAGSSVPVTVHVLRAEGFTNEIQLALLDAPGGFTLGNARLSAETNQFRVTVKAAHAVKEPCNLVLQGRALVEGKEILRTAVPADDRMQAFFYRHLVPAQEMKVAVIGRVPEKKSTAPKSDKSQTKKPAVEK